jgi:hypothetical protein
VFACTPKAAEPECPAAVDERLDGPLRSHAADVLKCIETWLSPFNHELPPSRGELRKDGGPTGFEGREGTLTAPGPAPCDVLRGDWASDVPFESVFG